jgi:hypothetical protein
MLKLDRHDQTLVAAVQAEMSKAIGAAHNPVAVARRIGVLATATVIKGETPQFVGIRSKQYAR